MKYESVTKATKEIFIENISIQEMSDILDELSKINFNVEKFPCEPFKEGEVKVCYSSNHRLSV